MPLAIEPQSKSQLNGQQAATPRVSVVLPVYNEAESLGKLHADLLDSLGQLDRTFEIIYVDDGSSDASFEILSGFAAHNPNVKVVRFRRNFGQTAAMTAGMDAARGEIIVPLDADGQNDPRDIARLLEKMDEGYDVVSGWRKKRQDHIWRKIPSRVANGLISRVTGVSLHDYGCSLKAYRASILRDVSLYGEMHRFIPAYAFMAGGKITEIAVDHHPRLAGESKYGFGRIQKVALDLLVARFLGKFGQKPIYFFGGGALRAFGLGILLWIVALLQKVWPWFNDIFGGNYESRHINNNPLFYVGILLFMVGVQLLMMGILAEMNMRIYYESSGKSTYIVTETRNLEGAVAS